MQERCHGCVFSKWYNVGSTYITLYIANKETHDDGIDVSVFGIESTLPVNSLGPIADMPIMVSP